MNEYCQRQAAKDAEYRRAWNDLTDEQRAHLRANGIAGPDVPRYRNSRATDREPPPTQPVNPDPEPDEPDVLAIVRRVIGEIISSPNIPLTAHCFALVTQIAHEGITMTEIAKRHGVTRAAVSARCVRIQTGLGLPPTRAMKPAAARAKYRVARKRAHAAPFAYRNNQDED